MTIKKFFIAIGSTLLVAGLTPIALGFGLGGVAAFSVAAGIQSSIGSVAAGSLFATFQSLGATGVFATTTAAGTATTVVGGLL